MPSITGFKHLLPNELPSAPGVFAIARYIKKGSTDYEILHCSTAENIRTEASKTRTEKQYDGFDKTIFYLVREEPDEDFRSKFLQDLELIRK